MLSLRRKADVHTLLHRGQRAYGSWVTLYARLRSPEKLPTPLPRLAVSTTGKLPNAVQRNRARRLLRETGRLLLSRLQQPWDILLIARPAILTTTFPERQSAIISLLCTAGVPEFTLSEVEGPAVSSLPDQEPALT